MALSSSLEGSIASAAAAQAYVATAIRLAGGPPLAYWRLASTDSVLDEMGTRNGIWKTAGGSLVAGLPQGSDGAVDFQAVATAEIPHDAGLALPAFTLSFWFVQHSLPDPATGGISDPLVSKDGSGLADGDTTIYVTDTGEVAVQIQTASATHNLGSGIEIELEIPYHFALRADHTGFDAYLDGVYLGKNANVTGAWTNNSRAIGLASSPPFANLGDCTLDEIAIYGRVLTEAEVLALAQKTATPVAVDDDASVPESATTAIDVLANDRYVGTPTIEIVNSDGGRAVAAGTVVNYSAPAVGADQARSFTYRITDPNGPSPDATVSLMVLNADTPVTSIANCFTIPGLTSQTLPAGWVAADLRAAVNGAAPGHHILIPPGTKAGGTISFTAAGTQTNPIVIRPSGARGTVTIDGANWTLTTNSARLVFANIYFTNSRITINGSHNRVSRCRWRDIRGNTISVQAATDTRIDHCDFSDYRIDLPGSKRCITWNPDALVNGSLRRLLIDYNYIHDIEPHAGDVPSAFSFGGDSAAWNVLGDIILDHCLFKDADSSTGEFINVKTSGMRIRFCTFDNVRAYLQQRAGGGWEVRSCWFENMTNSAPLKCFDEWASGAGPQLVIGNRLVNQDIWIGAGNANGNDTHTTNPYPYHRSREGQFIGNDCRTIFVGTVWGTSVFPALNNNLWDNTATITNNSQSGTTTNNPAVNPPANLPQHVSNDPWYEYTPAIKLTPSDVGLDASDPLCLSGPQS